jgi:L-alanine-DL-glutamate epimerase-like enolase superfamily enzyme
VSVVSIRASALTIPFKQAFAHASSSVRADANNLWSDAAHAIDHLSALNFSFAAVEEPLGAGDYAGMARSAHARCCAIIVDESVLTIV